MSQDINFNHNSGAINILNEASIPRATILGVLIEIIASGEHEPMNLARIPAEIENKIKFNDLIFYRWVVDEYISNSLLVDGSMTSLNQIILNGSTKLKRQMKHFYLEALAKYSIGTKPFDLNKLKINSDNVIKEVIALAKKFVTASNNLKDGYFVEDIDHGIALIVSYSIIECIVLENPNDHN
ncbi:hypothetical protein RGU72_12950 [Undibacterium sp. 5I1]|uniref:hypothetical protein n=1 Tax=unclassified Undibacterium TaxID=2630295 RepID=UPI002AB38E06|nr:MULTISPECIES: hypothetical protein [unclassified Undibacterium]MDY7539161.1 hypothetical protein [Undibacterium sp. 5I1]MEB0232411.1 hypothetical protein [Undibacterium sp. 10I3]MEB0257040.1 hypothetical protein [Undibacterium sp. 5I1]